ncbi:hypothetical protein SMGD1_1172 [Sulfurimonas gotlandica GD1]|jgi:hypothetical protein|uniref:Uncharacterized protein n=1 Tax=Sulfurimonas gotlandica (strain DSM 19862 / JCM 16533 / GD1) TaxID=929558 RepID=B6BGR5_SULGG|nr:DUF6488 family protein [Sulfurimonas gotlandica]EDZ62916.1 conserved hypothetical protein [Sulfurimonas gotlandica GD1]EHP29696.1 hypothetical protein SMGD1_1172 [Sulfurimonas gotlandica GD1]
MTKSIKTSLILLALTFTTLYAKNGYDYYYYGNNGTTYNKLNKSSISKIAKEEIKRLILENKISKNWRSIPISEIKKSNSNDWVVTFNNLKIRNKSKQNLYVFVNLYGHIQGVNYTGH